jgi:hypothetical protein
MLHRALTMQHALGDGKLVCNFLLTQDEVTHEAKILSPVPLMMSDMFQF